MDVSVSEVLVTVVLCMCLRQVLVLVRAPLVERIMVHRIEVLRDVALKLQKNNDPRWKNVVQLMEYEFGTKATMRKIIHKKRIAMLADITKWTYDGFYNKK